MKTTITFMLTVFTGVLFLHASDNDKKQEKKNELRKTTHFTIGAGKAKSGLYYLTNQEMIAVLNFEDYIEENPHDATVYRNRAMLFCYLGEYTRAIPLLYQSMLIDQDDTFAAHLLKEALSYHLDVIQHKEYHNTSGNFLPCESRSQLVFTVQIGAFRNPVPSDFAPEMPQLCIQQSSDGLNLCSVGGFNTYKEALALKNQLIVSGYPDAFITAWINNQRIDVATAIAIQSDQRASIR